MISNKLSILDSKNTPILLISIFFLLFFQAIITPLKLKAKGDWKEPQSWWNNGLCIFIANEIIMIHGYFSLTMSTLRGWHSLLSYWMRLRNQDASASVGIHESDNHDTSYVHPTFIFPLTAHTHTHTHSIILSFYVCVWSGPGWPTIRPTHPMPDALHMSVVLVDRYKGKEIAKPERH